MIFLLREQKIIPEFFCGFISLLSWEKHHWELFMNLPPQDIPRSSINVLVFGLCWALKSLLIYLYVVWLVANAAVVHAWWCFFLCYRKPGVLADIQSTSTGETTDWSRTHIWSRSLVTISYKPVYSVVPLKYRSWTKQYCQRLGNNRDTFGVNKKWQGGEQ